MSWNCPECGYSNPNALEKCVCGYEKGSAATVYTPKNESAVNNPKVCVSCGKQIPSRDMFCSFCGKASVVISEDQQPAIRKAANWILAISILFTVFGTGYGIYQNIQANKAKENLARFEDTQVLQTPINSKYYTVGELRAQIDKEVLFVFLTNYFLAAVMFVLYWWARRTPFPAMVTALCVYLTVIVLNAIIEPLTLAQGIVIKIIFIGAIIAGIKASLAARSVSKSE